VARCEIIGDGGGGGSVRGNEGNDGSAHDVTGMCTAGGVDGTRSQWSCRTGCSLMADNVLKLPGISFKIHYAVANGARDSTPTSVYVRGAEVSHR